MSFSRFSNKVYPAVGPRSSPIHLVVMHGLLGNHKNWASVCRDLSHASTSQTYQTKEENSVPPLHSPSFPCVAFDWRNHGASPHNPDHSLDGLVQDLEEFLQNYAAFVTTSTTAVTNNNNNNRKIPIILMGHSMGGMGLLQFIWSRYASFVKDSASSSAASPWLSPPSSSPYEIVGCVVVDIAPAPRPQAFWHTAQAVEQLRQMPLSSFRTIAEAEAWLLANGKPSEVFQQPESEWVVKYFLSNLSDARRTQAAKTATSGSSASEVGTDSPLRWDIALDAIAEGGLKKLLWANDNCVASLGSSSLVLPPIPAAVDAPPSPAKLPTQFLFGGSSPYRTEVGLNAIPKYFSNARVSTIPNGTHFLFVSQRKAFCLELYKFLRDVHHEKYSHTSKL